MNRIRELRLELGMTQKELSNAINCYTTAISKYELEQLSLDPKTIDSLCKVFDVSADYLLGRTEFRQPIYPSGEDLLSEVQKMVRDLTPEEEVAVRAFIAGMKASRKDN